MRLFKNAMNAINAFSQKAFIAFIACNECILRKGIYCIQMPFLKRHSLQSSHSLHFEKNAFIANAFIAKGSEGIFSKCNGCVFPLVK